MSTLIRRLILALATLAGLAPAFAQSPPPVPALPDTERRTSYSISGTTCNCAVGFQLFGDSTDYGNWVEVWLNGKQVLFNDPSFGWSISTATTGGLANAPRPITNAVLTFVLPQTGTVQIVGARRPRRTSQFQESQPVPTRNINQLNTDIIAMEREMWDLRGRLIQGLPGETMNPLPSASARANNYLVFDTNGNPITAPGVTLIQYIASVNYATVAALANSPVYANGASGVGATLTETGNGALSVDGNAPIVGNRILVLNQAVTFQNGIYTVTAAGSAGAPYVLTRAADFNQTTEMFQGVSTVVTGGTVNLGAGWTLSASVSTIGTSAVIFYQTSAPPPINLTSSNVSFAQDFVAGVGFTAGTTTALTTTNPPINAASSYVAFDGIVQMHNTWSLAGSTFTFNAAIPLNTQVVEIGYINPAVVTGGVQSIGGASGAILLGTNLSIAGQTINANFAQSSVENLLSNVQWQLWSGVTWVTTQNAAGTADETIPTATSFTTATQAPVFSSVNTQQLKIGDLVIVSNIVSFWGFSNSGYTTCGQVQCTNGFVTAAKVAALNPNVSVTLASPGFSGVSPVASASATLAPITPGDAGTSGNGADGWNKSSTLHATVDTWGASATPASTLYPGCERPLLLRKGITGSEVYGFNVPPGVLGKYRGQTVTFGAAVYHRVQGGANTWRLEVDDSVGSNASANGTGASLGGYQFSFVTRTIPLSGVTTVTFAINLLGNTGDVFDVCLPTAAFAPSMVQSQLKQREGEIIRASNHWNPPLFAPGIISMLTQIGATGLYGYNGIDLEAISFGTIHNTVGNVYAKLEWKTTTPYLGCNVFFGGNVNVNSLTFGLQAVGQVNGFVFPTPMARVPIYHDGTVAYYTDCSTGVVPTAATMDFTDVDTTPPIWNN